jgi:serine/threonine-protein kinase HipA
MRRLDVRLNGRLAGYYDYTPAGGVSFTYAQDWLSWENGFAISRQLPLQDGTFRGEGASAVFENLLPDNDTLRRIIAEKTEARSAAPHDLLSAIGRDCVGALQFLPHDADPGNPFEIEVLPTKIICNFPSNIFSGLIIMLFGLNPYGIILILP